MLNTEEPIVGKTYVTLEGDLVKIIGSKIGIYEYQGSNGKWYNDKGKTHFYNDNPCDLQYEVSVPVLFRSSHTPHNVTVEVDTTKLVVTAVANLAVEAFKAFRRR